jgi:phage tail-like protein
MEGGMEPEIKAILKLEGPDLEQDEVPLTREGLNIGRVDGNDLVLSHKKVSRRHARVVWQGQQFWVEDLESSNGTLIGSKRLTPHQAVPLAPGDVIRIGPYRLAFDLPPQPPEPPPALPEESFLASPPPPNLPEESRIGDDAPPAPDELPPDTHPPGVPRDRSSWLQYLPAIYANDAFTGRYLLIFESMLAPVTWMLDSLDLYLSPGTAPAEWLRWIASWLDLLVLPELPAGRLRAILREAGWLFARRGTRPGLARLLTLYFGAEPEIVEDPARSHFTVRLRMPGRPSDPARAAARPLAERLIEAQKPAFAGYTLEIQ